jgi:8-amino-7-oxononanoate synthase
MLQFASALYLGMRHPSAALGSWEALTLGQPAALAEPPGAGVLAAGLARLVGSEAATLLPSSLHLFWDLLGILASGPVSLLVDAGSYPIARWSAECAHARGTPLDLFAQGSAAAAWRLARAAARAGRRPLIVADGFVPGAGAAPPLRAYADIARRLGGWLVIDDTQGLGLFGSAPRSDAPYGSGGGGSARLHGLGGAHVVVGASLAKGFGAPLAVLCASAALVRRFEERSAVRVHSSPPSVAAIRAGLRALRLNRELGEALRQRLWRLVALWRAGLARLGLAARGGCFPVQTLELAPHIDGAALHRCLGRAGVDSVLQRMRGRATVSFLVNASHSRADIVRALAALAASLRRQDSSFDNTGEVI